MTKREDVNATKDEMEQKTNQKKWATENGETDK
jgi:hypothetical protein